MKMNPYYASLDIGSSSVTASLSISRVAGKLEVISLARTPLRAMNQGMITNLETVSATIRQVMSKAELIAGISAPPLCVSVSTAQSQGFQSHGIVAVAGVGTHGEREVTLADIERVVEMANSVSVPADRVILHSIPYRFLVDHMDIEEPHGASGIRLESEVYLVTQNKLILESIHKAVSHAGYRIHELVLQSIASAEGVVSDDEKKMGCLLIDIGGDHSDYVVIKNGGIVLTGQIAAGADHITKDLAYGLKTTFQYAEEVKIKYGHILKGQEGDDRYITVPLASKNRTARLPRRVLSQIIEPRVSEILSLIKKSVTDDLKEGEAFSSIVLAGGGSLTQDITEITEDIFRLPARIGQPLVSSSVQEDIHSPIYATLAGLQRLALEKWEREHKTEQSDRKSLQTSSATPTHTARKARASISGYFKGFFH